MSRSAIATAASIVTIATTVIIVSIAAAEQALPTSQIAGPAGARGLGEQRTSTVPAGPDRLTRQRAGGDQRRWLVRLQLSRQRVISGLVQGRPSPTKLWATESGTEYLAQVSQRLFLVDARQALVFQLPLDAVDTGDTDLELLLPYPVPVADDLQDQPAGPIQLRNPEVNVGLVVVPASGELASQLASPDGINMLPPIREFREVFLVHFRAGNLLVDLILPPGARR